VKKRAGSQLKRTLLLVAELLRGEPLDRYRAAKIANVEHAAAWAQLREIQKNLAGVRVVNVPGSRAKAMRFDLTAHLGETPRATIVAACLGMSMGSLFDRSKYGAAMREAFQRLVSSANDAELFHDHDRKFAFVPRGGDVAIEQNTDVLDEIIGALLEDKRVRIDVDHLNRPQQRHTVRPLSLVVHHHQLYLLGEEEGKVRANRVARIKRAKKLGGGTTYPKREDYDLKQVFGEVFGIYLGHHEPAETVRVRLRGRWAGYARNHRWHPSQKEVSSGPDEIEVTLKVRPCPEVEAWILGFGEWAEVLEPAALRRRVGEQAAKMAALYGQGAVGSAAASSGARNRGPGLSTGRRATKVTGTGKVG
jgi:predicted DNA-binding transcriptional regulator YafY